jgi:hypothetical protein
VIDTFDKNSQDEIKIILTSYKGALLLDIRSWRKEDAAFNAGNPTRRGISMSINLLPRLKKAVLKAEKYLDEHKEAIKQIDKAVLSESEVSTKLIEKLKE